MPRGKNNTNINRKNLPHSESKGSSGGKSDICIPFLTGKCSFEKGCRKRHPSKEEIPRVLARYKKTRCKFKDECYTEGCLFSHPKEEAQMKEPNFIASHHFPPLSDTCMSARSSSPDSASKQSNPNDSAWNKAPSVTVDDPAVKGANSFTSEQAAWGNPNGTAPIIVNVPPPQQPIVPIAHGYYAGPPPMPPMMAPNMTSPGIDPNTGYPIDPSVYYYDQQAFYYQQQQLQQMVPPYSINGMMAPPMGIPFNAEAKEFVPGTPTTA